MQAIATEPYCPVMAVTRWGPMSTSDPDHVVIVPIKPPGLGKSRLGELPNRRELAAAFAMDTLSACLSAGSVRQVLVVTDDAALASQVSAMGCWAIPDGVTGDLNESLRQAALEATRRWPDLIPVALCADLPGLRPADLDAALSESRGDPVFVADAEGVGTTTYSARITAFAPHFGVGSAAAHVASGARPIQGALESLRRDVDTSGDLDAAVALGVGPATHTVLTLPPSH
ncbi:2-phospho-L-lactate guanylyltransferase [soil metagenome]